MRKAVYLLSVVTLLAIIHAGCNKTSPTEVDSKTVKDIDGNKYETVTIGNQIWMAENLKVTHYKNGDPILKVEEDSVWITLRTGAYCSYTNNVTYFNTHGCMYNWYAVADSRGIAPKGWHVPTEEEWKELEWFLGMSLDESKNYSFRGTNQGSKLAGEVAFWQPGELVENETFGESGFNARPGGSRHSANGEFQGLGSSIDFWTATEYYTYGAWMRGLSSFESGIFRTYYDKQFGYYLRLVKD